MVAMGPEPTESTRDGWKVLESAIQERERIISTLSLRVELRSLGGVLFFAPRKAYRLTTSNLFSVIIYNVYIQWFLMMMIIDDDYWWWCFRDRWVSKALKLTSYWIYCIISYNISIRLHVHLIDTVSIFAMVLEYETFPVLRQIHFCEAFSGSSRCRLTRVLLESRSSWTPRLLFT